jgi:DNA-binding response OmpR family regulator
MLMLLVEDEYEYQKGIVDEAQDDYLVDRAYNGVDGAYMSQVDDYDLIVVDGSLPDIDGLEVCRKVRSQGVNSPILFMSDKDELEYKLESLEKGANAYITKPIDYKEFFAKAGALVRRRNNYMAGAEVELGRIKVDLKCKRVVVDDEVIPLRRREYDVLEYLVLNRGRAVTREEFLEHIWENGLSVYSNCVEVTIHNLRLKLERPFGLSLVETVRGFGYRIK